VNRIAMKQLKEANTQRTSRSVAHLDALVAAEPLCNRMLSLERRRCERTAVPFALLLFNLEGLGSALNNEALEHIAGALAGAMRETDITGWYRHPSIIGIILTTINETDRDKLESILRERTKKVLSAHLDRKQMEAVRVSFHVFPEDTNSVGPGPGVRTFYSSDEQKNSKAKSGAAIKRAIDVAGSLAALVVLSPVLIIIAALVKITSEGPVFFRQKRIGQYGKDFTFLKFRSMYVNNDPAIHKEYIQNLIGKKVSDSEGTYKIKNDPRVTSVGKWLRKTSLDEVPQFINVLKGEMSLVGPRPPIPYEFESYSLWHRRRILEAKPGITGEWQVHGRSRTSFDEMVRMDLRYIRHQSLWLDLKILLKTPFAVFSGDGAF
jgi:exopolysaccharide biosynthesis polyprenyl glycosylphosphotransferase